MNEHVPASASTDDDPNPSEVGSGPGDTSTPTPTVRPAGPGQEDAGREGDEAVLEQLESDLASVEQAIERLEQITAAGIGGEQAAARIEDAVPSERFRIDGKPEPQSEPAAQPISPLPG